MEHELPGAVSGFAETKRAVKRNPRRKLDASMITRRQAEAFDAPITLDKDVLDDLEANKHYHTRFAAQRPCKKEEDEKEGFVPQPKPKVRLTASERKRAERNTRKPVVLASRRASEILLISRGKNQIGSNMGKNTRLGQARAGKNARVKAADQEPQTEEAWGERRQEAWGAPTKIPVLVNAVKPRRRYCCCIPASCEDYLLRTDARKYLAEHFEYASETRERNRKYAQQEKLRAETRKDRARQLKGVAGNT
jgi:hypothetical protein